MITQRRGPTLPETSSMDSKHLEPLTRWCRPHGAWSPGACPASVEEAGVGPSESSPKCLLSLSFSAQQGREISCPSIEDTGLGGQRAFPQPHSPTAHSQEGLALSPPPTGAPPCAGLLPTSCLSLLPAIVKDSWSAAAPLAPACPPSPAVEHQRQSYSLHLPWLPTHFSEFPWLPF